MFHEIKPEDLNDSAIRMIGLDGMLVTAGVKSSFNTMTAAWGGLGFLWHKPVAFIFIRPQRYTYRFTELNEFFSLCFFTDEYSNVLDLCGSCSGRDTDKIKETGLKVLEYKDKAIYYEQARLALICRKLYYHDVEPGKFIDATIDKVYPLKDYHRMYIGEIEKVFSKASQ